MTDRKPELMEQSQLNKFKAAARELECDNDEARFNERVKKLMKARPAKPEKLPQS